MTKDIFERNKGKLKRHLGQIVKSTEAINNIMGKSSSRVFLNHFGFDEEGCIEQIERPVIKAHYVDDKGQAYDMTIAVHKTPIVIGSLAYKKSLLKK